MHKKNFKINVKQLLACAYIKKTTYSDYFNDELKISESH